MERGVLGPLIVDLITPFRAGEVDDPALQRIVERQIAAGIDAVAVCSANGEPASLERTERRRIIETAAATASGRVPILAGVCANSTQEALEMCREALDAGADGLLITVPYYNKPGQRGICAHFSTIAERIPAPIVIDNVPSRTGTDLSDETAAEMLAQEKIIGLVEEGCDLARLTIRRLLKPSKPIITREDLGLIGNLAAGGQGCVSTYANLVPASLARIVHLTSQGRLSDARRQSDLVFGTLRRVLRECSVFQVKGLLAGMIGISDEVRSPLAAEEWCNPGLNCEAVRLVSELEEDRGGCSGITAVRAPAVGGDDLRC